MVVRLKNMAILMSMVLLAAFFVVAGNERLQGGEEGQFVDGPFVPGPFAPGEAVLVTGDNQYIKWVDFNVSYEALCAAYDLDVGSYDQPVHLNWIELLAYVGAKNGGSFGSNAVSALEKVATELSEGSITMAELTSDMEYYDYYYQAYEAVLGGMVGEFEIERETETGEKIWTKLYGLKAFLPIAHGFPYSDYDDFGVSRSYGYSRNHLGHDMMGQVGTPIIAIESGYVEALGWNQYGGWRIGIRSFDEKRYYYYAHLRQNFPYAEGLEEGSVVTAGDVIGYMGHTGYSTTENTNNIKTVHLHWGMQLIFDESQKEGNNEIWVDCYDLTRFLYKNRSRAIKVGESKEWDRVFQMRDPTVLKWENDGLP
ncbi:MAG: M23 family metallopeptidase [Lachnospiraceae bacterium]|jgi:murein DD-endopeptidase MepM/ murein hydrolase activator NlpD|nr:M23 family metallopeptidase [Lachnospiraceae bacterium]